MRDDLTTWRKEIAREMEKFGETLEMAEQNTLTADELDRAFDSGFGGIEGVAFTVWTAARVYFPACYDGAEWCESVARHPNGQPTGHIGGWVMITATESEALRARVVGAQEPVRWALDCDWCTRPVFVRDYYGFRAGESEECVCGALNYVHLDECGVPVARTDVRHE